jgi:serine protease Do
MSKEDVKEEVSDKDKGYLGIAVSDVDSQISELYGVPQGARVETVSTKNAEKSDIKEGDIITNFEGKTINNRNELTNYLKYYKKGETVTLTVQRMEHNSYKEKEIKITLSSSSDMQQAEFESQIRTY